MENAGNPVSEMAIWLALTYDVIAATNSSPQTTEINAAARGDTLMKWVKLGVWQSIGFAIMGALMDFARGTPVWPPIFGSGLGCAALWFQYKHAYEAGLASGAPGTENYGVPAGSATGGRTR
jgi:hypothetical protein